MVGDNTSALQCVLNSDIERTQLLEEEGSLLAQQVQFMLVYSIENFFISSWPLSFLFLVIFCIVCVVLWPFEWSTDKLNHCFSERIGV